jgi:aldose 1-epimerase
MTPLILQSGSLTLALRPDIGGCVEGFWCGDVPVLRSAAAGSLKHARSSGSYPLVPFSNRVAKAELQWHGTSHPLVKNFAGEEHSIHGLGFERAWQVLESNETFAMMSLEHRADRWWPFGFDASQTFKLGPDRLDVSLNITNQSPSAAPVGLGWHPYFVKCARSRIAFAATGRWEMSAEKLPTRARRCRAWMATWLFLTWTTALTAGAARRICATSCCMSRSLPVWRGWWCLPTTKKTLLRLNP